MLSMDYWRQDASLKFRNAVFTIGSCGLSGYCGWLLAGENGLLVQVVTAGIFALIAYSLSESVVAMERYRLARDRGGYYRNLVMVVALAILNVATDYGASSTIRDMSQKSAGNANTNATNARNEVKRLEKKIAGLQGEKAWRTKFEAPASYDALINKQKQITDRGRNVWQRTKECTDTTLKTSQAVCQRIAELKADKANAERRQILLAELKTLGEQLRQAKKQVAGTPETTNVAITPIMAMRSLFTRAHDGKDVQDSLNFFLVALTLGFSIAIIWLSLEIGNRMGPMTAPEPIQPRPRRSNYWLEAPETVPSQPIAGGKLEATDSPAGKSSKTTVEVYTTDEKIDHNAIDRLMKQLDEDFGLKPTQH